MQFRIADLQRDAHLLPEVKRMAMMLLQDYANNVDPLIGRWLGHSEQYGQA
jgi:ATP-dependent DNA helicase RecG